MQVYSNRTITVTTVQKKKKKLKPRFSLVCNQCVLEASFIKVFHIPKRHHSIDRAKSWGVSWELRAQQFHSVFGFAVGEKRK